ncbi:transcription factor Rba50 [Aspergillus vadensis CBS 113365]|uniref:Transcription factor Rba50 n=1 Tax=Aspergillus vadensis (strain CBS 113365 / IMI 142717 / IBT 24658) TaxID=1448311 RepID=A0A319BBV8_ASPVC|nr:transcription factor Rba50 [Aspergillus vadensis CBS 113365]PYH69404.1 transcription factor Rba50 [Aspergillus vadensis CBS 113365]
MESKRPEILLLCIAPTDYLGDRVEPLLKRLRECANVKRATTIDEALRGLEANPKVVIVADEGVTIPVNRLVVEELEDYMRRGGLAIFGFCFPGFVTKDRFRSLFRVRIGLPWIIGDEERTKFEFNPECTLPAGTEATSLPTLYSMEAVFIKNARPKEKIYIPVKGAMTERTRPEPVDQTQAAVVGAKVGDGYVAYCGDTIPGKQLEQIILALCGF